MISVLNQKGGVGKTTISINLGYALQRASYSVLMADNDPQGSLRDWNMAGHGQVLDVIGLDQKTLPADLKQLKKAYDIVIVDGAPQLDDLMVAGIKSADLVLIPVGPSPLDVWSCRDLVDALAVRRNLTEGLPKAYFVISMARHNTVLTNDLAKALVGYNLPVMGYGTVRREVYKQTVDSGQTVYQANNKAAVDEIELMRKEIVGFVNNGS